MNKIIISIIIVLSVLLFSCSNVESISTSNFNALKPIEFTMYHGEDKENSCIISFKPKVLHSTNSISSVDSHNNKKAITISKCKPLSKSDRTKYQQQGIFLKTTVLSDKDSNKLSFSSLPKSSLNDSSLEFEILKINLDSNLNIIASNYQLKKQLPLLSNSNENNSPASDQKKDDTPSSPSSLLVIIEFSEDVLKLVYDEPKVEKEKEKEKKEEEKSFIGKYWFYILPLFLIMIVNLAAPPPAAAGAQGGAAAPAKK